MLLKYKMVQMVRVIGVLSKYKSQVISPIIDYPPLAPPKNSPLAQSGSICLHSPPYVDAPVLSKLSEMLLRRLLQDDLTNACPRVFVASVVSD